MAKSRKLSHVEILEARKVFASSLDYGNIFISNAWGDVPMTIAGRDVRDVRNWLYIICWSEEVFQRNVISAGKQSTFIHEMTHVWQGQNGVHPMAYMGQSVFSQLYSGIKDIIEKREWRTWGEHRSTAYPFTWNDIGKNWNEFNVEQQASIVQSWYIAENDRVNDKENYGEDVYGGGASPFDARFPYIRDVIRARDRNAKYQPVSLPVGANSEIKNIQDKLVALGYLDAFHADGIISRGNSPTVRAIREFQRNNGLKDDGDMGTANSQTRRKLQLPISQLNHR